MSKYVMPIYLFENEETGEVREIFQGMNEAHEYFGEDGEEKCWSRIFSIPNAGVDTKQDIFSAQQFMEHTGRKKGTYGDMLNLSAELSEKRAQVAGGVDPVKEKYYDDYAKARNGAKHVDKFKKTFETKHVKVEM